MEDKIPEWLNIGAAMSQFVVYFVGWTMAYVAIKKQLITFTGRSLSGYLYLIHNSAEMDTSTKNDSVNEV